MRALRAPTAFDGERFLEGGATVLVEGDRIAGVEGYGFQVPDGVEVTTYDGTLLPGLVDAHVHLVADGVPGSLEAAPTLSDEDLGAMVTRTLAQHAAAGVTTVRDLGDTRYVTLGFRDALAPGAPRIVAAGPPFTTENGHCHYLGGVAEGPVAIRAAVAEHVERGVDVIKVMASGGMLTPGSDQLGVQFSAPDIALITSLGHEAGLPVVAHTHSVRGAWHALEAGVDGLEHFTCLTDDGMVTSAELLDALAAAGVVVDQTTGWNRDLIDIDRMPAPLRMLTEKLGLLPDAMVLARADQARRIREHGVEIVVGTDAGISPPKTHGDTTWRAVVELAAAVPLEEALARATSYAASVVGVAAVTGRLHAGLDADLLVVDGDVRADASSLSRPVAVLVRGAEPLPHSP
jgi:imidazolonepropionase-like amidohydrolase